MPTLQEARSAETRRRLMEAAVACLYERGYAGTTTIEIAARAGVSRGAQLHHFPTKDELVVSALEHVFDLRAREFRDAVADIPSGSSDDRLRWLIDLNWRVFKGPTFYAWLELVVASRTDETLKDPVRSASERLVDRVERGFAEVLDWPKGRTEELVELIGLIFGQLEALALERVLFASSEEDPPGFQRAIESLKNIACSMLAAARRPAMQSNPEVRAR
jgi:AcrR family transcriptional regulator